MIGKFTAFQSAYVTTDLGRAVDIFQKITGIKSFLIQEGNEVPHVDGGFAKINYALAWTGDLQLELIEPVGGRDAFYREGLPTTGYATMFHHQCIRSPSLDAFERTKSFLQSLGCPLVFARTSGAVLMFYADTRPLLGHALEYVWFESDELLTLGGRIPHYE